MSHHTQETILIVEDHETVRTALREWLEVVYPKSRVIEAASGEQAIDLIVYEVPRLVIMDFKLPGINGIEVTRQIKSRYPSVPVVMLTIREEEIYRAYAEAAGASAYIPKRMMFTKLRPTIRTLLSETGN